MMSRRQQTTRILAVIGMAFLATIMTVSSTPTKALAVGSWNLDEDFDPNTGYADDGMNSPISTGDGKAEDEDNTDTEVTVEDGEESSESVSSNQEDEAKDKPLRIANIEETDEDNNEGSDENGNDNNDNYETNDDQGADESTYENTLSSTNPNENNVDEEDANDNSADSNDDRGSDVIEESETNDESENYCHLGEEGFPFCAGRGEERSDDEDDEE